MKKQAALLLIYAVSALAAGAANAVYDPADYKNSGVKSAELNSAGEIPAVNKKIETKTKEASNYAQNAVSGQSPNFNNALYELDSAQVTIRNQLLEYQSKYQQVDTQYKLLKEQRRVLSKQIKAISRKVNAIEKSKKQIRKTMT